MRAAFRYVSIWWCHYMRRPIYVNIRPRLAYIVAAVIALALVEIFFLGVRVGRCEEVPREVIVRAVMNEASNQGSRGMEAAAWMFRNRISARMTLGSSGLWSRKLTRRLRREKPGTWRAARRAVEKVFSAERMTDPTRGALWCENVREFGVPRYITRGLWRGELERAAVIGEIHYWRIRVSPKKVDKR